MKTRILIMMLAVITLLAIISSAAEAKKGYKPDDKGGMEEVLETKFDLESPGGAIFDSVRNVYYVAYYGHWGIYPFFIHPKDDSSDWDGGIMIVNPNDYTYDTLPILLYDPSALEIYGDTLYVADMDELFLIDLNSDTTIARVHTGMSLFYGITDMAQDTSGNIYLSSMRMDSILKYNIATREFTRLTLTGESIDSIGSITFEARDNSLIMGTYRKNAKILKLNLNTMNVSLAKQTGLNFISGIDTDRDGNVYIALDDRNSTRAYITKFRGDFTGDSVWVTRGNVNEYGNIYYNKLNDVLYLSSIYEDKIYFLDLTILRDTVKLIYPPNNADGVETDIEFKFHPISRDYIYYYYFISNHQNFDTIIAWDDVNYDSTFIINNLDTSTTYYWRVYVTSGMVFSEYSETFKFTTLGQVVAPNAIYPPDSSTNIHSNVNFHWSKPGNANSYLFESFYDPWGYDKNFDMLVDTNEILIDDFNPDSTYYWRVKAIGESGASSWSKIYKFTTASAILGDADLISPELAIEKVETDMDFEWEAVPNATNYIFKLYEPSDGYKLVAKLYLDTNACTINNLDTNGYFHWFVKAYNTTGTSSWTFPYFYFSTVDSITYYAPILTPVTPDGKNADLNPLFTWQNTSAASYKLQLAEYKKDSKTGKMFPDFLHPVFANNDIKDTKYKLPSNLKGTTKYAWKVKAVYDKKTRSGWSDESEFETKNPNTVEEISGIEGIRVYPNPVNAAIIIDCPEVYGAIEKIEIINILGENIRTIKYQYGINEINLDTENLTEGIYIIKIQTGNGIYQKRIVKMRE